MQSAIRSLEKAAHEWADVDEGIVFEIDNLINQTESLCKQIAIDIKERIDAGEQIGR